MAELIDDDVLDAFSVVAPVNQVASRVQQRLGDTVDRFSVYSSDDIDEACAREILAGFRSA